MTGDRDSDRLGADFAQRRFDADARSVLRYKTGHP